jgi:proline dehydrogenase
VHLIEPEQTGATTMALMRNALLWASRNPWLAQNFPRYRFAKAAVRRFMPGTTAEAAMDAAVRLEPRGIASVFTHLGENLTDMKSADAVVDHYLGVFDRIAERELDGQVSIKLTQLGLDISEDGAIRNLITLAARAAQHGNVLWVDIEDSSYVDRTLAAFRALLAEHRNVGLCLQAYLRRTADDLDALLEQTAAIRLVKGAYLEPPEIAFPEKSDVDESYYRLACRMADAACRFSGSPSPVMGTHDLKLIERITAHADGKGIPRDAWQIHMLYGIRTAEQMRLAEAGHRVRVLVSYGEQWFPWYVRRLAERPANLWFVARSMVAR